LRPASARALDQSSFLAFLLRLPHDVAFNTWSLVWNLAGASRPFGGAGASPEVTLINFDEADSARLEAGAETRGVKPYAALAFAAIDAYRAVLGESPHCLVQQASLQTRHYEPKLERNVVGDWLVSPVQRVPRDRYTLEDAQRGYEQLVRDLDTLGEEVRRAFDAKAYGFLNGGAAVFEAPPTYGLDAKIWDSVFFNNYGVRSICPEAGFVSWNWAAPFKVGFNAIHANGRTCITLTSYVLGSKPCEPCETMRRRLFAISWLLRRFRRRLPAGRVEPQRTIGGQADSWFEARRQSRRGRKLVPLRRHGNDHLRLQHGHARADTLTGPRAERIVSETRPSFGSLGQEAIRIKSFRIPPDVG
jgi:hypothetical protein